ncbi:uncharacterized protein LTHEOB_3012 [Neofusicoccum parvum]|uniref:Uncharacterized protein LTHEOB_3012 n=1 Tax=Neofusicoccum parvum TaxID=310453 RepID=A0ACB5S986_9PEZI|nr:uncharacterized protein LTHEOB_3012 [Neofusicoccum parvum]
MLTVNMIIPIVLTSCYASVAFALRPYAENFIVPTEATNGSAEFSSTASYNGVDSVQIQKPNTTSYEWWYFDATAADASAAVVFQPVAGYMTDQNLNLRLNFAYENGTFSEFILPREKLFVSTVGAASSGLSADGSYSWHGAPDLSEYIISMDIPELGISGDIRLQSIAPAHGPCGPAVIGETLEFNWDLYWVNAIPDAQASVNLQINGTTLAFQGPGYHDKNWAPFNFIPYLNQWYWGHGRAGDLSVVWFYHLDTADKVVASAYIARDNRILHSACAGVTVRPFGEGVEYPLPAGYNATVEGYEIEIDAGALGNYSFTATAKKSIVTPAGYDRWIGILEGGLVGGESSSGAALWEMMGPAVEV